MRKILLPAILVLFISSVRAQLTKPVAASVVFSEKLSKIAASYRDNYYQVQGDQLSSQDDIDVYSSSVILPGAQHCVIYRFHSKNDTTASWQAIMYEGDDYKKALNVYKSNCRLVNHSRVNLPGSSAVFNGKIENPNPNLRFVSSLFYLNTKDAVYRNFYAEVEMVNINLDTWEVRINLHSKRDDDGGNDDD